MIKRNPILYKLNKQQQEWLNSDCCPICGLPESKWKRRTDWKCCSKDCTDKFSEVVVFIWQFFKLDAFKRDNYSCVKCGKKPLLIDSITECDNKEYLERIKNKPDTSKLIGDHIIPISLGGEEYDLENVQTLCEECNKKKTKQDQKDIAKQRRIEKKLINQNHLNNNI